MFDEGGEWQPAGRFPCRCRTPEADPAARPRRGRELGLAEAQRQTGPQRTRHQPRRVRSSRRRSARARALRCHPQPAACGSRFRAGALRISRPSARSASNLKDVGCQMGIEHFGRQFSETGCPRPRPRPPQDRCQLHPRAGANVGNQSFLAGLTTIAHGIGMKVIAEGVANEAELRCWLTSVSTVRQGPESGNNRRRIRRQALPRCRPSGEEARSAERQVAIRDRCCAGCSARSAP